MNVCTGQKKLMVAALVCGLLLSATVVMAKPHKRPMFETVTLANIAIEAAPFEGAPQSAEPEPLMRQLSQEATMRAERDILQRGIAGKVLVTGVVRLPLSLPPEVIGLYAAFRKGTFATARIAIFDAKGTLCVEENISLQWDDAWWATGAIKFRRNRPLNKVLVDFVRRGMDDAFKKLSKRDLSICATQ